MTHFMENFCPEICGALEDVFLFGLPHMWQTVSEVSLFGSFIDGDSET